MSLGKWEQFRYANSSNLNITNPNMGHKALRGDWYREADRENGMLINGTSLKKYASMYDDFNKEEDVISFFNDVILSNFNGSKDEKENAITFLKKAFHQGGLMYPVSSALSTGIFDENNSPVATIHHEQGGNGLQRKVNIQTNDHGFSVQELCAVNELLVAGGPLQKDGDPLIKSQTEGAPLIFAQGTVQVDFSKNPADPSLTVESNQMKINHTGLSKYLDNRSLGQMIVDFIKNAFGLNKVKEISPKPTDSKSHDEAILSSKSLNVK